LRVGVEKYISVILKEITLKKEVACIINCVTNTTFANSIMPRNKKICLVQLLDNVTTGNILDIFKRKVFVFRINRNLRFRGLFEPVIIGKRFSITREGTLKHEAR
jgi:hypothetical protein